MVHLGTQSFLEACFKSFTNKFIKETHPVDGYKKSARPNNFFDLRGGKRKPFSPYPASIEVLMERCFYIAICDHRDNVNIRILSLQRSLPVFWMFRAADFDVAIAPVPHQISEHTNTCHRSKAHLS